MIKLNTYLKQYFVLALVILQLNTLKNNDPANPKIEKAIDEIQKTLNTSGVISPNIAKEWFNDINFVAQNGSPQDINELEKVLKINKPKVESVINTTINSILNSKKTRDVILNIAMVSLQGALIVAAFEGLIISAGNKSLTDVDLKIILGAAANGAIVNILKYSVSSDLYLSIFPSATFTTAGNIIYNEIKSITSGQKVELFSNLTSKNILSQGLKNIALETVNGIIAQHGGPFGLIKQLDWLPISMDQKEKANIQLIEKTAQFLKLW